MKFYPPLGHFIDHFKPIAVQRYSHTRGDVVPLVAPAASVT